MGAHKEMAIDWVEQRKYQHPDGTWQRYDPTNDDVFGPVYTDENDLDEVLWREAVEGGMNVPFSQR